MSFSCETLSNGSQGGWLGGWRGDEVTLGEGRLKKGGKREIEGVKGSQRERGRERESRNETSGK